MQKTTVRVSHSAGYAPRLLGISPARDCEIRRAKAALQATTGRTSLNHGSDGQLVGGLWASSSRIAGGE